jgi:hypothetical protein
MLPDLTAIEWISVSSLSLSLAALLARFIAKEDKVSARMHLLTAGVVLAMLSAGVATAASFRRASEIATISADIYLALGNQQKTTDQLVVELGPQKELSFNAALAQLKAHKRIEAEVDQVAIRGGRPNAVRLWRALPDRQ